ncbi:hypothetical protein F5882DRAFT_61471 [Hyaloscypha sp. PMI_1271]|nr:hypothetical protein F5882DRAFT_61471 [Hyaloscypha sp. PMI_1271]
MAIQQRASSIITYAQCLIDTVISPDTRKEYYNKTVAFAQDQPILFTFVLIQFLLSSTPVAIFLAFALGALALSFITALLFSLFWIGVALLLLVPTLFITVSLGIVLWVWAVSSFLIARWVYNFVPSKSYRSTDPGKGTVVKSESGHVNSVDPEKNGLN